MSFRRVLALFLTMAAFAGCPTREVSALNPIGEVEVIKDIPVYINRNVDILFVIDNSGSMAQEQASLAVNMPRFVGTLEGIQGGLPDVHIGVVSSNVGIGTYTGQSSCPVGGDRGRLQNTARVSGCVPPSGYFISDVADTSGTGGRIKNYTGTLSDTFVCIASLGTAGCGFEQHFQSMKLALDPLNPVVENANFLRDGAYLALIFLQDEDDCSARDASVFDPSQDSMGDALGPFGSYRCAEFGVECCTDPGAGCTPQTLGRSPTTYNGPCQPRRDSYIEHPDEYFRFIREIKGETTSTPAGSSLIIAAAISGQPEPFAVTLDATSGEPKLVPSCTSGMGTADPGVRINYFLSLFGERGTFQSICQDDLQGALDVVASLLARIVGNPCLVGYVNTTDIDPEEPGLQLDCQITDTQYPGEANEQSEVIRPCEMVSDTEIVADQVYPCWWVKQDLENCNPAEKPESPTGLVLYVERNGGSTAPGTHVIAHCVATEPRCGDNRLDNGEDCDDGNNYDGDSCPADCTVP